MKKRSIVVVATALSFGIAAAADAPLDLLGQPAVPEQAQRTVVITPTTRYVNVTEGDVVRFIANGVVFAFNFDSSATSSFTLNRVAPPGALDHTVTVYVARNLETEP
jgi:Heavy-metal resistance protein CzcE